MQRSILSGVLSVAGTKVLTLIIGLLTTPILYRILNPEGVGVYTTVLSVFSLFMIFVSSGVTDGVRKFLAEDRDMDCWEEHVVGFYFRLALALSVVGSVVLALTAWFGLVEKVFGPGFEPYFYVLAVLVVTDQFRAYARRTLMGFGLERYSEPLKVLQQIAFVAVAIPLAHAFGVEGALTGKIAAGAVVAVAGLILVARQVSLSGVVRTTPENFPRRTMLTFNSLSIVLILLLMSLYHVDILMLQLLSGSKQVGYYRAALKLAEFLWFIPLALQTVFVHSTSELWSNGETEQISELAARTTRYTFLLTGVMALGLAALSNVAVPVYFGPKFIPAIAPLLLLLPGTLGFAVARPILAISQGKGDLKFPILATGTAAVINLVLNSLLIPRFGTHGAAISTSIGYGSMFIFHLWSARKVGFDPLSDARLGRVVATTVLSAPPIFVLAHLLDVRPVVFGYHVPLSLVIVPPLGLVIFTFFCFATGALGLCEVLKTLSSFPEPLGSYAESLRTKVREDTMSSDSMQKAMVVAGVLLFVSGIGYAFIDPGLDGLGGGPDLAQSKNTTESPAGTTPAESDDGTTERTTKKTPEETTKPPESTTEPPDSTTRPPEKTSTTEPPEQTTEPPSTTTSTTPPPSTTSTTPPPSTTTTTTTTTATTTSTTSTTFTTSTTSTTFTTSTTDTTTSTTSTTSTSFLGSGNETTDTRQSTTTATTTTTTTAQTAKTRSSTTSGTQTTTSGGGFFGLLLWDWGWT